MPIKKSTPLKSKFNDKQIQILEVAETLFAEKGFDGTSIRDIAKEAKINIAMVSYYFGSKERLLESLIFYRTSDLKNQLDNIGFYSNAIQNPLQVELAEKLGKLSGYENYTLFLCSSGAEANENALKLASFHNGKSRVIAFDNSFHGRTSAAVAVTDNKKIVAPINAQQVVTFLPLNNIDLVEAELQKGDVCCVIIEGIQGVGGLDQGTTEFFQGLEKLCKQYEAVLILDEVQSGYGRTGKFFAHQHHNIKADIICLAKGMGNGFPIGGVLISPKFFPSNPLSELKAILFNKLLMLAFCFS